MTGIELVVVFCMKFNPTMCKELEMVPVGREITSIMDCMMGGAIGGASFAMDHVEWTIRGVRCREKPPTSVQLWLRRKDALSGR